VFPNDTYMTTLHYLS